MANAGIAGGLSSVRAPHAPWLFELLVLFALLLLFEFTLTGQARLLAMSPNPFWIPVLLLATQYGVSGGLAAALTAITISFGLGWPSQTGAEDLYDYSGRIWHEPILWLGAAVMLGGLRAQHIDKFDALRAQLGDANDQRQAIATYCNTLKSLCEDLQRHIACSQDRSIEAGFGALAAVANSSPPALRGSLASALDLLVGPASYRVLIRRDGKLIDCPELAVGSGSGRLAPDLETALVRGWRTLSVLRDEDAAVLAGSVLFAAPIIAPGSERVLGALVIDRMDATRIGEHVEESLLAVATALSRPLVTRQVVINFESRAAGPHLVEDRVMEKAGASAEGQRAAV